MYNDSAKAIGWLASVGCAIGLGQLLSSKEKLTARIIMGRALSSAGIGAASSIIFLMFPDVPLPAQLGAAATMASLGTSFLEKLVQRFIGKF